MKRAWYAAMFAALAVHADADGQVRTDASLGQAARTLTGPGYLIPETLGRLAGKNLFHSFQAFSLSAGDTANFTTTTPGLANVIARVTGGDMSTIHGELILSGASGKPAFFFINPAGITFGAGARLDVPGAFHVSTADSLRFPDGDFHASLARSSTFSSAAPEAFGFLGGPPARLTIGPGAGLVTPAGNALGLVAGDIVIDNGIAGTYSAPLRIAAVGSAPASVPLDGPMPVLGGDFSMVNDAYVQVSHIDERDAGKLTVGAGSVNVNYSAISSIATASAGGMIDITAAGRVAVENFGVIESRAEGTGRGGDISVRAGDILITSGSEVTSAVTVGAPGGALTLAASGAMHMDDATVRSYAYGPGTAGTVRLSAGAISLAEGTHVYSAAFEGARTGLVEVSTPGQLRLLGGAGVTSLSTGVATGTTLRVNAGEIHLSELSSLLAAASGAGARGGNAEIVADGTILLDAGGNILTYGIDGGIGGSVRVAAGDVTIKGSGQLNGNSHISSGSDDDSNTAGDLQFDVRNTLSISNEGFVTAATFSGANGGDILIRADNVRLDKGVVNNGTFGGTGNGGRIDIEARKGLDLVNNAYISTSSHTLGTAGDIFVRAGSVSLDGESSIDSTAALPGGGGAGNIGMVVEGRLTLSERSSIDTSTGSAGDGGTITIAARDILLQNRGAITSLAITPGQSGSAGAIDITASGLFELTNEARILTNTRSDGDAGSIRLKAGEMRINGGEVLSEARPGSNGNSGAIDIAVIGALSVTAGHISTNSHAGSAGTVLLRGRTIALDGADSGIFSASHAGSAGKTGIIDIGATESIRIGGFAIVGSQNFSTSEPGTVFDATGIRMAAPRIVLDRARVTTESTGKFAAGTISIASSERLDMRESEVKTTANNGDGGAIAIDGGALLVLENTGMTTSVLGSEGNGGNIRIATGIMLLKTGFIQANTAASNASGGTVDIDVGALVATGGTVFVGGLEPLAYSPGVFGYNVIQAAAPTGVSGTIAITSPVLDVSGSLRGLNAQLIDTGGLGRDSCQATAGSSLTPAGRGGLPATARGLLGAPSSVDPAARGFGLQLVQMGPASCR